MENNKVLQGDCLDMMQKMGDKCIDMIYLDPPFYTQQEQSLTDKDGRKFIFNDKWASVEEYIEYIRERLVECHRVLKDTGSLFLHCDRNASHYLRLCMDEVFGYGNFQSEIIWCYKRWSNSKKGLLNNHQTILFYSKTDDYKFNAIYTDYSETTNIDQILQDRVRDENGKAKYKRDESGSVVMAHEKKGVPLSDVWEIPYLNPKAKERVGYPTQKPVILLERIIRIATDEGDLVLDPFAGSGTTLVAAKKTNRNYLGFDISDDAVRIAKERIDQMVITESFLLKKGRGSYLNLDEICQGIIKSIDAVPVQRNSGIDGFMKEHFDGGSVSIRIQRDYESLAASAEKLVRASKNKGCSYMVLIRTRMDIFDKDDISGMPDNLIVIDRYDLMIRKNIDMYQDAYKNIVNG